MHLTDKQIESLVEPVTRRINFPNGKTRVHTMDRLSWQRLDDLEGIFAADEVVKLVYEDCRKTKRPFELMFPSIIEYIFREWQKRIDPR